LSAWLSSFSSQFSFDWLAASFEAAVMAAL
jgi:hypothetical protein